MSAVHNPLPIIQPGPHQDSRGLVLSHAANEHVFGVVGHVGSGTSEIAKALRDILNDPTLPGGAFDCEILKARDAILGWAGRNGKAVPAGGDRSLTATEQLQDLGDEMRSQQTSAGELDCPAVARSLILTIRTTRATKLGVPSNDAVPVVPDGRRRAYILDSLRHPAEVELLRHVYQEAFVLIGVVCEEKKRLDRIVHKYADAGHERAKAFMKRDAEAKEKHGQHVADTFHLSDFFVDNTVDRLQPNGDANPAWDINERLARLVNILTHSDVVRPDMAETAMHHAHGAMMQSACMSRQVGAALVDRAGNIISTGTNEVPKAGGGVYGETFGRSEIDDRCALRRTADKRYCSNTREQNRIIEDLISEIPELAALDADRKRALAVDLRRTRIGGLLEFSRAVHAEMDALLSAAREGFSLVGTRLFVTTFPCHYCARHLVTAGVDEVQYIEPYPKSQALDLHEDAIQVEGSGWKQPSEGGTKVLFRPFSGVAPRMYKRSFMKDRDLKNKDTGLREFGDPTWGSPWHLRRVSYVELEADLARTAP